MLDDLTAPAGAAVQEEAEEVACDHAAFLRCLGEMQECNLWVAIRCMLSSPQARYVRRHGNSEVRERLGALETAVRGSHPGEGSKRISTCGRTRPRPSDVRLSDTDIVRS